MDDDDPRITHRLFIHPSLAEQLQCPQTDTPSLGSTSSSSVHLCVYATLPSFLELDTKNRYLLSKSHHQFFLPSVFATSISLWFHFHFVIRWASFTRKKKKKTLCFESRCLIIALIVFPMIHVNMCVHLFIHRIHILYLKLFIVPDTWQVS